MNIPMLDLRREYEYMKEGIDTAIHNCLKNQQWILGPQVKELEERIAQYLSAKYCIGASSGTDALVLALRALAIKRTGKEYFERADKIITTPFTFTATGDSILRAGATPVFVDIDPATFNIDPKQIKQALGSVKGIVGILPVHLYGQSCDMDTIMTLANEFHLFVVEDVAQAFGGSWKNKKLGTIGDLGTFSFFPSKNLGGFGDGGMVATNDQELAELVRMLTKHGGKNKYNVDHIGYNGRLDTLQAAILLVKLKYLDELNLKRQKIAEIYLKNLRGVADFVMPNNGRSFDNHVFHQFTIRVLKGKRDSLQAQLKNDLDTMVYYPVPLHQMAVFNGRALTPSKLSESEKACEEVLSLPIEPLLSDEEIKYTCDKIIQYANGD